jgi:hypothetical protein
MVTAPKRLRLLESLEKLDRQEVPCLTIRLRFLAPPGRWRDFLYAWHILGAALQDPDLRELRQGFELLVDQARAEAGWQPVKEAMKELLEDPRPDTLASCWGVALAPLQDQGFLREVNNAELRALLIRARNRDFRAIRQIQRKLMENLPSIGQNVHREIQRLLDQGTPSLVTARKLADRYFFGSDLAFKVIVVWVGFECLGVLPREVDQVRTGSLHWCLVHGPKPASRWQRRKQSKWRKHLRKLGWRFVDETRLWHEAKVWVRARLVHRSLRLALVKEYGESWDPDVDKKWRSRLRPYDLALGWERRPGRPRFSASLRVQN